MYFASKLGCFIAIVIFSYVTKWESLTAKIEQLENTGLVGSTPDF